LVRIPLEAYWPVGFTTDYVTFFPDKPLLFLPKKTWKVWKWLTPVDLKPAAWWHDVQYYLGYKVNRDEGSLWLGQATPIGNESRSENHRRAIDEVFRKDCIYLGVHPATAEAMSWAVRVFGRDNYYWKDS
jgi:hypothetical protein